MVLVPHDMTRHVVLGRPSSAGQHIDCSACCLQVIGRVNDRSLRFVSESCGRCEAHDTLCLGCVPMVGCVLVVCAFLGLRLHTTGFLPFPDGVVHYVVLARSAEEAVCRERVDAVAAEQHVLHRCLLSSRTQPVTVHQFVLTQVQCLNAVVRGQIGGAAFYGDVIDRLALCHVLVVQFAYVSGALCGQQVDLAVGVADDELFAGRVIMDTVDAGTVQARLTVIDAYLLRLFVYAIQAAVRDGVHLIGRHGNLGDVVVCKVCGPFACMNRKQEHE